MKLFFTAFQQIKPTNVRFKECIVRTAVLTLMLLCYSLSVWAQAQTYYTKTEALKYLFAGSKKVSFEKKQLTPEQAKRIQGFLKTSDKIPTDWTIYTGKTDDKVDGYVIIDNILGKEALITFAVNILPTGAIKEIEILVYRESHGGQVKNKMYRQQFVGKTLSDPIRNHQDITNISGATISSTNVAYGVKRALAVWQEFYNK